MGVGVLSMSYESRFPVEGHNDLEGGEHVSSSTSGTTKLVVNLISSIVLTSIPLSISHTE